MIVELFGVGGDGEECGGEHGQGDVPVPGVVAADQEQMLVGAGVDEQPIVEALPLAAVANPFSMRMR